MFPSSKRVKGLIGPVLLACLVGYFLFHAVQGEHGIVAMLQLQHKVRDAQEFLSQVRDEREQVERNVKLMRGEKPDPDLLEEQAHKLLNHTSSKEIVVMPGDQKPTEIPQRSNEK